MDSKITVDDLKRQVQRFCEDRDWDRFHDPKELSIGLITEASELLVHFRFKTQDQMKSLMADKIKKDEISEEMADVLFFLLRMSQMNNIDLSDALQNKIKKNNIKYPVEKAKGLNKKYNEL